MKILNLTQHIATAEQIEAGVVEPMEKMMVRHHLTVNDLPSLSDHWWLRFRVEALADIAKMEGVQAAMIGGAPFLMPPLERALLARGIKPLYAFSKRESVDEKQKDGTVKKTQIFRHTGFVEAVL